jgi:hypothetical protein
MSQSEETQPVSSDESTSLPEGEVRRINEAAHAVLTAFDAHAAAQAGHTETETVPDAEVARINAAAHAILGAFRVTTHDAD